VIVSVLVRGEEGVRVSVLDFVLLTVGLRERCLGITDALCDFVRRSVLVKLRGEVAVGDRVRVVVSVRGGVGVRVSSCVGVGVLVTDRVWVGDRVRVLVGGDASDKVRV
jgi:hypothetical protein